MWLVLKIGVRIYQTALNFSWAYNYFIFLRNTCSTTQHKKGFKMSGTDSFVSSSFDADFQRPRCRSVFKIDTRIRHGALKRLTLYNFCLITLFNFDTTAEKWWNETTNMFSYTHISLLGRCNGNCSKTTVLADTCPKNRLLWIHNKTIHGTVARSKSLVVRRDRYKQIRSCIWRF